VGDNKRTDREVVFRAPGRFVETLGGRYITADRLAEQRIAAVGSLDRMWMGGRR